VWNGKEDYQEFKTFLKDLIIDMEAAQKDGTTVRNGKHLNKNRILFSKIILFVFQKRL